MPASARSAFSWLAAALLLAACSPYTEPPEGPYAGVLKRGESVTEATPAGPFTALSILYRQGGGFLTSTQIASMRLLYRDRVLIKQAEDLTRWDGLEPPVYFAEVFEKYDRVLQLAYERDGKAVVQKLPQAVQYRATKAYPHGFPMAPGLLYFPGDTRPGFLLRALPVKSTVLPETLADQYSLFAHTLAAISPDGAAFALVDSHEAPSMVMVVDADGGRREAIGLPRTYLPEALDEYVNPYERVWNWARTTLAWYKNADGKWEVRTAAAAASTPANAVEELFLDDQSGYRQCFAASNASCLRNWRGANAAELRKAFGADYAPPFAYVPQAPVQAFGANVRVLLFARLGFGGTAYSAYVDGAQEALVAQLSARLQSRKIPFVRVDECPRRVDHRGKCEALLAEKLKRGESLGHELEQLIVSMEDQPGMLFILPSMAVVVRARPEGGSMIQTLLRADFSRKD